MKKKVLFGVLILCVLSLTAQEIVKRADGSKIVIYDDHTWQNYIASNDGFDYELLKDGKIPYFLRDGIKVQYQDLKIAVEMYFQGWKYTMPRPKSAQAAWGNGDRRTTWFNGYWYNEKTKQYSKNDPMKMDNGQYNGDYQNEANTWRNGGSPQNPTIVEWLLSDNGGIKP